MTVVLGWMASAAANAETIKIGVINSMSGKFAPFSESVRDGLTQAVDEINSAGGIKSRKIELVTEDDQSDPEVAVRAFEKLAKGGVVAVVGPISSVATRAIAPVAARLKLVAVSPVAHESSLAKAGPYTFLMYPTTERVAKFTADVVAKRFKAKRVAILNPDNDWGKASTNTLQASLKKLGVEVASAQTFTEGQKDFTQPLTAIKAAKPDVLVYPSYYDEESIAITQKIVELGMVAKTPGSISALVTEDSACRMFLDHDIVSDPAIRESLYFVGESIGPPAFQKSFQDRFRRTPTSFSAAAHATLFAVKRAVELGGAGRTALARSFRNLNLAKSSFGKISFKGAVNAGSTFQLFHLTADKQFQPVH